MSRGVQDAIDLGLANSFEVILQADDGGVDIQRLQPGVEFFHLAVNDGLGLFRLFLAIRDMGTDRLLQIIDIVNEDSVEFVHLRIDVARDGDIDKKHGAVTPAGKKLLGVFGTEDKVGRAGRRDHDVSAVAGIMQPAELDRLAFKFLCQPDRAIIVRLATKMEDAP